MCVCVCVCVRVCVCVCVQDHDGCLWCFTVTLPGYVHAVYVYVHVQVGAMLHVVRTCTF